MVEKSVKKSYASKTAAHKEGGTLGECSMTVNNKKVVSFLPDRTGSRIATRAERIANQFDSSVLKRGEPKKQASGQR